MATQQMTPPSSVRSNPAYGSSRRSTMERASARHVTKGTAMPVNYKTTTIQARISREDKKFLKLYAESQGITLSELLRRSATALIQIIKSQQGLR